MREYSVDDCYGEWLGRSDKKLIDQALAGESDAWKFFHVWNVNDDGNGGLRYVEEGLYDMIASETCMKRMPISGDISADQLLKQIEAAGVFVSHIRDMFVSLTETNPPYAFVVSGFSCGGSRYGCHKSLNMDVTKVLTFKECTRTMTKLL